MSKIKLSACAVGIQPNGKGFEITDSATVKLSGMDVYFKGMTKDTLKVSEMVETNLEEKVTESPKSKDTRSLEEKANDFIL